MTSFYGRSEKDVVVLVTSMDMADKDFGGVDNRVMGVAQPNGLCSVRERVAIVEDQPHTYSFIQLITHELAHMLGASHDGETPDTTIPGMPKDECDKTLGYIMAPRAHGSNSGHFSNCSIMQIKAFVRTLNEDCKNVQSTPKPTMLDTAVLPGTNLDLTSYCEHKHPSFCNITARKDNIKQCQFECCPGGRVKCFYREPGEEQSCSEARDINVGINCKFNCCLAENFKCFEETAVDGMSCGDGMMCFRNKCTKQFNPLKEKVMFTVPEDDEYY